MRSTDARLAVFFLLPIIFGFFQNFFFLLINFYFDPSKYFLVLKDFYIILVCLLGSFYCYFLRREGLGRYSILLLIFILILSYYLFVSIFLGVYIESFRQILILPLALIYGEIFSSSSRSDGLVKKIENILVPVLIFLIISGYVELFFLHDATESFWSMMNFKDLLSVKGMDKWAYGVGGVLGNFYSYDLISFFDRSVRRMVSLFIIEPTIFGHIASFLMVYAFVSKRFLLFILSSLAVLLTISKGGVLVFFLSVIIYNFKNNNLTKLRKIIINTFTIAIFSALVFSLLYLAFSGKINSVYVRIESYINIFLSLIEYPFGQGIGSSGNYGNLYGTNKFNISESYFGAMVGQIGIFAIFLYVSFFYYFIKTKIRNLNGFLISVYLVSFSTLVVSFFTESSLTYSGTFFLYALLPFINKKNRESIYIND
ncbi:hypothetical protein [Paenalcaligenes suwonensis]|uniref:hypothetical protein n=1 Tax=Paenalcaligenes suwonensis TaxID=1202713 RepID=UPI0014076773|nr:hypothetical protein [Paenalcaligenes suwonensis]NHC60266.1 hypothetical protein [Paenalcaligenes suwonensis]